MRSRWLIAILLIAPLLGVGAVAASLSFAANKLATWQMQQSRQAVAVAQAPPRQLLHRDASLLQQTVVVSNSSKCYRQRDIFVDRSGIVSFVLACTPHTQFRFPTEIISHAVWLQYHSTRRSRPSTDTYTDTCMQQRRAAAGTLVLRSHRRVC